MTIGEVAGCQRTLIESLDMNFIEGEVKGVISAGSQYNQTEAEGFPNGDLAISTTES